MEENNIFDQTKRLIDANNQMKIAASGVTPIERIASELELRKDQILQVNKIEKDSPFYEWVEGIYNDAIQIVKMTV